MADDRIGPLPAEMGKLPGCGPEIVGSLTDDVRIPGDEAGAHCQYRAVSAWGGELGLDAVNRW